MEKYDGPELEPIEFAHFPTLGVNMDTSGRRWHVQAIVRNTVCAEPVDQIDPNILSTAGNAGGYFQSWRPHAYTINREKPELGEG